MYTKHQHFSLDLGITNEVDEAELRAISSQPPENHMFFSPNFDSLPTIKDHVLSQMCYGKFINNHNQMEEIFIKNLISLINGVMVFFTDSR